MREVAIVDQFGPFTYPDSVDAVSIYKEVCLQDCYRLQSLRLEGHMVNTVVDLGASYGVASRVIRHLWPDALVIAFEPDPTRFSFLQNNCPGVDCRPQAVAGWADDYAKMLLGIGYGDHWRETPDLIFKEQVYRPGFLSHPISVHNAFEGIECIDLLKIDIEGFELGVIQEMAEIGLLAKTGFITGEWHFHNARIGLMKALEKTHTVDFVMPSIDAGPWQNFYATPINHKERS